MRRAFWGTAALLLGLGLASSAQAVTLGGTNWTDATATTLTLSGVVPSGNQPQNAPCIICAANQPQQPAGFGYNDYKQGGNITTISAFSDSTSSSGVELADDFIGAGYTVGDGSLFQAFLEAGGGPGNLAFSIGIDVNDTGTAQTLESFWFLNLTQKTVLAAYSPGPGGTLIPSVNNGTGFPDYSLTGFNLDRGDIALGDRIIFLARLSGMNDGPDSFFLNSAEPSQIPLPAGLWLFGSALGGLGALKLRSRKRKLVA